MIALAVLIAQTEVSVASAQTEVSAVSDQSAASAPTDQSAASVPIVQSAASAPIVQTVASAPTVQSVASAPIVQTEGSALIAVIVKSVVDSPQRMVRPKTSARVTMISAVVVIAVVIAETVEMIGTSVKTGPLRQKTPRQKAPMPTVKNPNQSAEIVEIAATEEIVQIVQTAQIAQSVAKMALNARLSVNLALICLT